VDVRLWTCGCEGAPLDARQQQRAIGRATIFEGIEVQDAFDRQGHQRAS